LGEDREITVRSSYLHYKVQAAPESVIQVKLSGRANVRLLDTLNYYKYRAGRLYQATCESTQELVVNLKPPRPGEWHVIVDLKGQASEVRAFVQVLKGNTTS
jgi:hypothetical protein